MTKEEIIRILVNFVIGNSSEMHSSNPYERCILRMEEISEKVLKVIHERLKNEV